MRHAITSVKENVGACWIWFKDRADSKHAQFWLVIASIADSWAFFFPPEVMLAAMVTAVRRKWWYYALITTVFSIVGALFAYATGVFFFDTLGNFIISILSADQLVVRAGEGFSQNAFLILFLTILSPIPSVPFFIAAGFFKVPLGIFLLAALFGRTVRFYTIAFIARTFGPAALAVIARYANISMVLIGLLIVLYIVLTFVQ